jgi:hypothetical protein
MLRLVAILLLLTCVPAQAQVGTRLFDFGAADDPTEGLPTPLGGSALRVNTFTGPSYIGVEWHAGVGFEADAAAGPFALGLGGRLRVGAAGLYEEDADDTYDLLRLLRYARFDGSPRLPVYARVGPLTGVTLGTGHLVHHFQTTTAWEERTVGVEAAAQLPALRIVGFAEDVRFGGLVGGRVTGFPFEQSRRPRLQSVRVGASAVGDIGLPDSLQTAAFSLDARFDVLQVGDFALAPFASYAWFHDHGDSFGAGADFASEELIGLGRLGATLALFRSGDGFIPGYFNAFYPISNPEARIWNADAYYRDRSTDVTAGTPLAEAAANTAVYFRLRALVFDAFELATFVRRVYGDDALSQGGLRLTVSPGGGDAFRFIFEVQRQGRTSFFSLFDDFRDQNTLVFHLDYALTGPARLFIRSRYGYTRVADGPDGTARYLVERRFEPFIGVRLISR